MAPKKRKSEEAATAAVGTRRSARIAKSGAPAPAPPSEPQPKKKKVTAPAKKDNKPTTTADDHTKTIVIEHCKQCNQFKTRANKVKDALQTAVPSVNVLLNPAQPRRGCFEIREEGGETFISLLGMKRPFQPMRDLDMEKVISDIVKKIK